LPAIKASNTYAPGLCLQLRHRIARVAAIDVGKDGRYILAYKRHFVACRMLDSELEINFCNRFHVWHRRTRVKSATWPVQWLEAGNTAVNAEGLDGIFQI